MDGILASLMLYGCKLAKELEQNLPMLANQPDIILIYCEEIVGVFSKIKERLIISQGQMSGIRQPQEFQQLDHHHIGVGIQEWLRTGRAATSTTTTMNTLNREPLDLLNTQAIHSDMKKMLTSSGIEFVVSGSGGEIKPPGNAPDSNKTSSSQKQRRRKDEDYKLVKRVPAPQIRNLDLPPEDGYTWRKYGQKEILGSTYPRSYYRCTHQKLYDCPAKKQVQRLEDDPFTFEVTYRGTHTCHVSSSTSVPPADQRSALPPPTASTSTNIPPPLIMSFSSSLPITHGLSMQLLRDLGGTPASGGGGAGPSAARFPDYQLPVADMADAMFNSASSSNNSMDLIFSSMDDKWDSEEKKDI